MLAHPLALTLRRQGHGRSVAAGCPRLCRPCASARASRRGSAPWRCSYHLEAAATLDAAVASRAIENVEERHRGVMRLGPGAQPSSPIDFVAVGSRRVYPCRVSLEAAAGGYPTPTCPSST